MRFCQTFLLVIAFAVCGSRICLSQVIQLKNPSLGSSSGTVHAISAMPDHWELKGKAKNVRVWDSPGSSAIAIGNGATLSQVVELKPLEEKLANESEWRLMLAVDVTGKFTKGDKGAKPAKFWAGVAAGKKLLARENFVVKNDAPVSTVAKPTTYASSFKANSGRPEHAFDGNRKTIWHSHYGSENAEYPHHLTLDFGEVKTLRGFQYAPRLDGGNGTVGEFDVEVTRDGAKWKSVFEGRFKYSANGEVQTVVLPKPVKCRAFRLVCVSSNRGDVFASCSELIPDVVEGFDGLDQVGVVEEDAPIQRFFVPVDANVLDGLQNVTVAFGADTNRFVVVDRVHLFLMPAFATMKMRGKPNGHAGPDLLGAGSYGFKGLMIHQYPVLPIIEVLKGSPAEKAGLVKTDVVVGVNGKPLPIGNVNPGFEWFEDSHESRLGRAALEAMADRKGIATLNVLRQNELVDVGIRLDLPKSISNNNFMNDTSSLKMLNDDLIDQVVKTQKEDGSWRGNPIHTCLGGLALLATGEKQHASRIKGAANWLMARNAEPGTGFYWHPAFSGIFLCEYYLATGDERTLPVIKRLLALMSSAYHTSKWGTETFGHGPKGLPYGNKSLVAVMTHVLVFEALAQRCGVESTIYERLAPYLESAWSNPADGGHGAMGYNASYKDLGEFWSRTGLFSLFLHMTGNRKDMQGPMAKIMYERFPWFRNSHAYGEPGGVLGLIGLSQVNSDYFKETLAKYRWWFALAWQQGNGLHFTIPHMGSPYMESPELINNGYAIVTGVHKKSLHITGSKKKNWLDVSRITVPLTEPMILQGANALVSLRCKIPGHDIFYTTNDTEPNSRSAKFKAPFSVEPGAVVRAIAFDGSNTSKVVVRGFGLDKSTWKVVACNGHKDSATAVRHAGFAIDGDNAVCWIPDNGEGTAGYPYEVVFDLGETRELNLANVRFMAEQAAATHVLIEGSAKQNESGFRRIGESKQDQFNKEVRIELSTREKVRFVKFTFAKPFGNAESKLLMVGEIELL